MCACVKLQVYLGRALHSWVSHNECMHECMYCVVLCSTATRGHICIRVRMLTSQFTTHRIFITFSPSSFCAAWRIGPPDCCPHRAPRCGQGPCSSIPRLAHGEWNRPVLHGPRWWPPSWARGGVPLQQIPFSEAKGEPPLNALTYSYLGVWGHHLLLSHCLSVVTHCLCRCVHTVVCSSMPAGVSATASTHYVSQRVVHIWTYWSRLLTQLIYNLYIIIKNGMYHVPSMHTHVCM